MKIETRNSAAQGLIYNNFIVILFYNRIISFITLYMSYIVWLNSLLLQVALDFPFVLLALLR